jgi:hypothetical protein
MATGAGHGPAAILKTNPTTRGCYPIGRRLMVPPSIGRIVMKTIWVIVGGFGAMMILSLVMIVVGILHLAKVGKTPPLPTQAPARCHCESPCPCKGMAHRR